MTNVDYVERFNLGQWDAPSFAVYLDWNLISEVRQVVKGIYANLMGRKFSDVPQESNILFLDLTAAKMKILKI